MSAPAIIGIDLSAGPDMSIAVAMRGDNVVGTCSSCGVGAWHPEAHACAFAGCPFASAAGVDPLSHDADSASAQGAMS